MEPRLVLSVQPRGTPNHPRYLISDQLSRVWTGKDWSFNESDGLLFDGEDVAGDACRELLLDQYDTKPAFRFTAPVTIEIRSDRPPDLETVRWWLIKAARLYTVSKHGNGPHDGLALVSINWLDLTEDEKR